MAEGSDSLQRRNWLILLPTSLTLGTALFGFAAIALAFQKSTPLLSLAAGMILCAWVCDMLDGLVARLTKTSSPFGAQLDSLCDAIGFGVAPGVLVGVLCAENGLGPWGWVAGGVYMAAALVRLARFSVETDDDPLGHLYFTGLPSPAAGVTLAALALIPTGLYTAGWRLADWFPAAKSPVASFLLSASPWVALGLGLLMVSTFRYADLPKHYLRGLKPRWHLILLAALAVYFSFEIVLALFFLSYVLLSPLAGLTRRDADTPHA